MRLEDACALIERVIDPMPLDRFLDDVVGRKFVKIGGAADHFRTGLLGADPRQSILADFERLAPRLGCHAALPLAPHPTIEPVADATAFKAKVDAFHQRGYTVRLRDVRGLAPGLDAFLRALECVFHQPANVESFWSRDDARAPLHHDDCDLIVIPLIGRKRWYISTDPPSLPNAWKTIPEGPPVMERFDTVDVGPGDLLYIPRGTQHRVDAKSEALHLSIGFIPMTLREAMIAAVDHLSEFDRRYRVSIGNRLAAEVNENDFAPLSPQIREGVEHLLALCGSDEFIAQALQRRSSRAVGDLEKLKPAPARAPLSASTRLRHSALAMSHLMANPEKIDFSHPGGHIYVHRGAEESVQFIAATPEFAVRDIPGTIADDVRLALAARFVEAGFLEIAAD